MEARCQCLSDRSKVHIIIKINVRERMAARVTDTQKTVEMLCRKYGEYNGGLGMKCILGLEVVLMSTSMLQRPVLSKYAFGVQ